MLFNDLHDSLDIAQYFVVPESKNLETLRMNKMVTSNVISIIGMLPTVYFQAQTNVKACKIQNIGAKRKLSTELEPGLLFSQLLP